MPQHYTMVVILVYQIFQLLMVETIFHHMDSEGNGTYLGMCAGVECIFMYFTGQSSAFFVE